MPSLAEFAEEDHPKPGQKCRVCNHPRREEIDAGLRAGIIRPVIERWLIAEGTPISQGSLRNHQIANYHE